MAGGARRISVGFDGGQVLGLRVDDAALKRLHGALGDGGWHEMDSEEGPVRLNLGKVVYVSAESDELRVGFG
jgi:hypothetical protein